MLFTVENIWKTVGKNKTNKTKQSENKSIEYWKLRDKYKNNSLLIIENNYSG